MYDMKHACMYFMNCMKNQKMADTRTHMCVFVRPHTNVRKIRARYPTDVLRIYGDGYPLDIR